MSNLKSNLFAITILILSIFSYLPAAKVYFTADDFFYIFQCRNLDFYSPFTHFFYQPLTLALYFVNRLFFGLDQHGYHLVTITINALNNVLIYIFLSLLTANRFAAFVIALLHTVYYFSADNMIWLNCTNNVLCAFFYFSAIIFSIKFNEKINTTANKKFFILLIIFINLTLYTREMGVSIFLVLTAIDLFFYRNIGLKNLLKKNLYVWVFFIVYLFVMAIGPTTRYGHLSFDRGAYKLMFDFEEILININWFFYKTFIPFGFGSHYKILYLNYILEFIRLNFITLICFIILTMIIKNKFFYFGGIWILLTASPYLLLNKYFTHTGERYFYLPHLAQGLILYGIYLHFKPKLENLRFKKLLFLGVIIILFAYCAMSVYAIRIRINYWFDAGQLSKKFINTVRNTLSEISEDTVLIIKDIPRWRHSSPKLIVLVTGATFAVNLYYNKKNIEVIPYWQDADNIKELPPPRERPFKNKFFFEYKENNDKLLNWQPPADYLQILKEKGVIE